MTSNTRYTLLGWHLSYFTGKALCYLRYKQVPFRLKAVNAYTLLSTVKKKTGASVMPVLLSSQGEWIQDTSVIIDRIESEIPARPVIPVTPAQRCLSYWLEAWADEWWIPHAMYTRWAHEENVEQFRREAGQALLPWTPRFLQNKVAQRPIQFLSSMLPSVGVKPEQFEALDRWIDHMLEALDDHFAIYSFLLGECPTLGDFALAGPMYAHFGRDPWSKRELIDKRPHLRAWIERISNPGSYKAGDLLPDDRLPDTLLPLIRSIVDEFLPMVTQTGQALTALSHTKGLGKTLPRSVGPIQTTMAGLPFERHGLGFTVWMAQRATDSLTGLTQAEQEQVRRRFSQYDAQALLDIQLPRVEQRALRVAVTALPTQLKKTA